MKKFILGAVAVIVALWLAAMFIPISIAGQVIELRYNRGGDVHIFLTRARYWAKTGASLVIKDMQVSAAGLAVLEARKLKVKMCYAKSAFGKPLLKLHQSKRKSADGRRWEFRDDAAIYGYRSPINGHLTVTMAQLGIKKCTTARKADKIIPRSAFR